MSTFSSDNTGPPSEFEALRESLRNHFSGGGVSEPEQPFGTDAPVPERLVQAIWMEGLFERQALTTATGKPVETHDPGRWNGGAGPDFLNADLTIDGNRMRGDVEIHVDASQWAAHGHDRDFAYNGAILHVCLTNDDDRAWDSLHNGSQLERLVIGGRLTPDLDTIRQTLSPEDYPWEAKAGLGLCHDFIMEQEEEFVGRFLASGGRDRMEDKAARLESQLRSDNFGQVFYQALMTAMGVRGNKALFFLLAKRAPLDELLDFSSDCPREERAERMQAILMHVAGLAPSADSPARSDDAEVIDYLNRINRHWAELSGYFSDRLIPPTKRWRANIRPVNFPERRIAGVARFILRNAVDGRLFEPLVEQVRIRRPRGTSPRLMRMFLKSIEDLLSVDAKEDFWARRYSFQAKPAKNPMTLIGASRARSVAFNSLLPLLILHARTKKDREFEDFCWAWFRLFPKLQANTITRFMQHRLFGETGRASSIINTEATQQGLFQIFHTCCNDNDRDCSQCYFMRANG